MKSKAIFMGAILMMGIVVSSCSDNDDNCTEDFTGELTENEKVLLGDWVLSAITSDEAVDLTDDEVDNPSTDIYTQYTDCQKDAGYSFNEDRSYDFEQGARFPDCENKLLTTGTWQYANNQVDFVSSCTIMNMPITFIDGNNSFQTVSKNLLIQDVTGEIVQADVTFVYTLE